MASSEHTVASGVTAVSLIDYIAFRLSDAFDMEAALRWANAPVVDENGEQIGINIEPHQWGFYFSGKDIITMAFKQGGEPKGYALAKKYNLRVTRLDIAHDVPIKGNAADDSDFPTDHDRIKQHFALRKKQPDINLHDGSPKRNNLGWGASYWSRSNSFQFAAYGKRFLKDNDFNHYNYFYRREIRLHGDKANDAFQFLIADSSEPVKRLNQLFQSVINEIFEPDFFQIEDTSPFQFNPLPAKEKNGSKEGWALTVVAPSFARHFKETGAKLWELVTAECEAIILADAAREEAKIKTTSERRVARISHLASEKSQKLRARQKKGEVLESEAESAN
jgi:hypothetical protein